MPIIWRYLYKQFFKVFLLTTISFIFILLITRLKEIARFISLSPNIGCVLAFVINIVPYILPIAIPIASLLSVVILFQKLSRSHELTALRCSGFSLFSVIFPIISVALLLSLLNFYIVSELTSHSQIFSRKTINELITTNPFYLLENRNKLRKKDFYVDMTIKDRGKSAQDLFIITPDKDNKQLNLMSISELTVNQDQLYAPSINVISMVDSKEDSSYDHLVIENENNIVTSASDLTKIMHKTFLHVQPHHLCMPFLKIALDEKLQRLKLAKEGKNAEEIKRNTNAIADFYSEIVRRLSIGLSVFTFTMIGIAFSIEIGRNQKRLNLILMASLTIFGLICFFVGKIFHYHFWLAAIVYLSPHLISNTLSIWKLSRTMRGIE